MARYEWMIVEVLVLGIAVYELIKIRRAVKRDRAAKDGAARAQAQVDSPPPR